MNDASHNHGEQENTVSTYSVDVETLQQIALKGDAQALFQLAINYEQGRGVAENQQEAFYCYQQAAELGPRYRPAQSGMGLFQRHRRPSGQRQGLLLVPESRRTGAPHRAI